MRGRRTAQRVLLRPFLVVANVLYMCSHLLADHPNLSLPRRYLRMAQEAGAVEQKSAAWEGGVLYLGSYLSVPTDRIPRSQGSVQYLGFEQLKIGQEVQ